MTPPAKQRAAATGALILALGAVPNLLWRSYGFSGGVGFPLVYDSWTDNGIGFDNHDPIRLMLNAVLIVAMAVGGSLHVVRCAEARLPVSRSWLFLLAAAPAAYCGSPSAPWTTRLQFLIPVVLCLWLFLRPRPLPWLLVFLLYASGTLLAFPSVVLFSGGGIPTEAAYLFSMGLVWLAFLAMTLYLFHARPRSARAVAAVLRWPEGAVLELRFQGRSHVYSLVMLILFAIVLSVLEGFHWSWVLPLLLLFDMPHQMRQSRVVVDEDGVSVGSASVVVWAEVESLARRGWTRAIFSLKNGKKKSLLTLDWPLRQRQQFYALLAARGL